MISLGFPHLAYIHKWSPTQHSEGYSKLAAIVNIRTDSPRAHFAACMPSTTIQAMVPHALKPLAATAFSQHLCICSGTCPLCWHLSSSLQSGGNHQKCKPDVTSLFSTLPHYRPAAP